MFATSHVTDGWSPRYWRLAAIIPIVLYSFDAAKISLYHIAQSPNVSVGVQLGFMALFYGLWIFIPRLIWATLGSRKQMHNRWRRQTISLFVLAATVSSLHLLLLTFLTLIMFAHAAWQWEPIHVVHRFGEIWLSDIGIWLFAYLVIVGAVIALQQATGPANPVLKRYEVRENGKTLSIPLSDIYWVKAAGNYVELHTARGVTMVRKTLGEVTEELKGGQFLKSHRSALINASHVAAIKPHEDGSAYIVQLTDNMEAPLSRRRLTDFKKLLRGAESF